MISTVVALELCILILIIDVITISASLMLEH